MTMNYCHTAFHHSDAVPSLSVTVWERDGEETSEYNLSDYKGGQEISKIGKRNKLYPLVQGLLAECRDKIAAEKVYRAERERPGVCDNLKFAFLVKVGRGGVTVYIDEKPDGSCRLSSYGRTYVDEAIKAGIPVIDTTAVSDDRIFDSLKFPMVPDKPGREHAGPWTGMSFAPIPVLAALYKNIGATVHNVEPDFEGAKNVRGFTIKEMACLVGYETGDSTMLMAGMNM
jgi:hypothetical protein